MRLACTTSKPPEPRPRSSACDVHDHLVADLGARPRAPTSAIAAAPAARPAERDRRSARRAARCSAASTRARRARAGSGARARTRPLCAARASASARDASASARRRERRDLVEQRERDLEHLLERGALTRSPGSWLRSVPLARFTQSNPCAISALASEPPPLAIRCGSCPHARSAASATRDRARGRRLAVAGERALHADVDVAVAVRAGSPRRGRAPRSRRPAASAALLVEAAHLADERAARRGPR